jgi:hypothetical protein
VSTYNHVSDGDSTRLQPVDVVLDWAQSSDLKYTSFGTWLQPNSLGPLGAFAYGIPTATGDVPVTGSANYGGEIRGVMDNGLEVWGSIAFGFNFGAGALTGEMKPYWAPDWDAYPLGTYTFTNTVYSSGSTTFSGAFIAPPGAEGASSFEGRFNGPKAAELMGSWKAPYHDPVNGATGTMAGVFGGKKGP